MVILHVVNNGSFRVRETGRGWTEESTVGRAAIEKKIAFYTEVVIATPKEYMWSVNSELKSISEFEQALKWLEENKEKAPCQKIFRSD